MRWGALSATLASGFGALLLTANAGAATPQQFYRDLADNGHFDRKYSRADVDRALSNASLPAYARPEYVPRKPQTRPVPAVAPATAEERGSLPFTGLDAALLGAVGAPLLLLGAGMRRYSREAPELG